MHADKTKDIGVYRRASAVTVLFLAVPAFAAVDGTVVNKTTGKVQAGATVTLYKLGQTTGPEQVETVKSGPDGKFHISQTPAGPNLIETAYDGVTYNHILPPGSPTSDVSLEVFNSSKQPGGARVVSHILVFQPSGDRMTVAEVFDFRNNGTTTYNDPDGGTLKFYLPPAAGGVAKVQAAAPQGMPIERAAEKTKQADIYKVDFAIKPGDTSFQVTYQVPYTSGDVFEGKVVPPSEEPTMLGVPPGITLSGDGLESKGVEPRNQISVFSVKGTDFKVQISGTATVAADAEASDNSPQLEEVAPRILQQNMKWILALALAILALGFIVLYRAQPASAASSAKGKNDRGRR